MSEKMVENSDLFEQLSFFPPEKTIKVTYGGNQDSTTSLDEAETDKVA